MAAAGLSILVLKPEYPDDPGAALGQHNSARRIGADRGWINAFDRRRDELKDRARCRDEKLVEILCDPVTGARMAG